MIGRTLAHYEVIALLGRGGMGEVYRARDTRLGRDVALKLLPPDLADDRERLARFRREARTLAALSHPNIAAIHGLEEADGLPFLVMELVEGEELSKRLRRSALPLEEALAVARQIVEGVEAAHAHGIVHRDLKPANVMLGPEGAVKLLDFGLARALGPEDAGEGDPDVSPTITAALTAQGVILGTAAYMSPEQAHGRAVDHRADIWSVGVILWEMLTNQRLFAGESVSDTLAAVIRAEPDFDALPADTPPNVRRLLRRCLRKKPRERLQAIGDARLELEESEPESVETVARSRPTPALLALVAMAALALGGALGWLSGMRAPGDVGRDELPLRHQRLSLAEGVQLEGWSSPGIALSPDGSTLAYVGDGADGQHLYLRRLDAESHVRVPDSEWAEGPFFSPDGRWVAFANGQISGRGTEPGQLRRHEIGSGSTQTICRVVDYFGGTWAEDGTIFYVDAQPGGLWRVPATGGAPEALPHDSDASPDLALAFPELLPGDRTALVIDWKGAEGGRVNLLDLETAALEDLGLDATFARYVPTGHLLLTRRDHRLQAVPFDLATRKIGTGRIDVLTDISLLGNNAAAVALSGDGTLVYSQGPVAGSGIELSELVWVRPGGRVESLGVDADLYRAATVSTDARRVAVSREGRDVYVLDLDRGTRLKLPRGDELVDVARPRFTPDSRAVVIHGGRVDGAGTLNLYLQSTDGVQTPRRLESLTGEFFPGTWVPGTQRMVYWGFRTEGTPRTEVLEIDISDPASIPPPRTLIAGEEQATGGAVSPDGRWLAYSSQETGRFEVYLRSYPDLDRKLPVGEGTLLGWSPDGSSLYTLRGGYLREARAIWRHAVEWDAGTPRFRPPVEVSHLEGIVSVDLQVTEQGILALREVEGANVVDALHVVQGWTSELRRLLPGD